MLTTGLTTEVVSIYIPLVNKACHMSEPSINLKHKSISMWKLKCILIVEIVEIEKLFN